MWLWLVTDRIVIQGDRFAGMKSRSRCLGLETVSRPDFDCLGLGRIWEGLVSVSSPTKFPTSRSRKASVSSRSQNWRSRSRLGENLGRSHLGLVSDRLSNLSVSSRSRKKRSRLHPCRFVRRLHVADGGLTLVVTVCQCYYCTTCTDGVVHHTYRHIVSWMACVCVSAAIHKTVSVVLLLGNMQFKQEKNSDQAIMPDDTGTYSSTNTP